MILSGHVFCFSAVVAILLKNEMATGSTKCSTFDFPCEDGECIDAGLWCDSSEDCADGSDEKYCKRAFFLVGNPNKCPLNYFKCKNGPCIPEIGRCDGYENCEDSSDERNCEQSPPSTKSHITDQHHQYTTPVPNTNYHTTPLIKVLSQKKEIENFNAMLFFASLNASQNSVQVMPFSGLLFSDFSEQRTKARNWIFSERRGDYGWGEETPRAITALYLPDDQPIVRSTESDMLMIKQLEIQLSIELARNGTKPIKLTDLALYINALFVSCKNPKNFYGDNLVITLRDGVNVAQKENRFIYPSIYLTLCLANATTYDDTENLQDIFLNPNSTLKRIDMEAMALLATACIFRKTSFLNASMYDNIKMEFLRNVKVHGFPGNVYEAALLIQALQELKITLIGLKDFILKQQQPNGSFGDILSTYLVLPILAGRNMLQMNDYCGHRNMPDLIPLEVLKNVKSKKMHIQFSLNYGFPPEVSQTLQMHVTKGTNFLDVMRLAQEINPKYRFKLNGNHEVPVVYSIGEMPNDVEKGMYWTLFKASRNGTELTNEENWVPYNGDIKKFILVNEDKVLFWYRPI